MQTLTQLFKRKTITNRQKFGLALILLLEILESGYHKMNVYFFGEEEICLSDFLWFYGMQLLILAVSGITMFIVHA